MTFFPDEFEQNEFEKYREKKVVTKFLHDLDPAKISGSMDHRSKSLDHPSNPWMIQDGW